MCPPEHPFLEIINGSVYQQIHGLFNHSIKEDSKMSQMHSNFLILIKIVCWFTVLLINFFPYYWLPKGTEYKHLTKYKKV